MLDGLACVNVEIFGQDNLGQVPPTAHCADVHEEHEVEGLEEAVRRVVALVSDVVV